MKALLLAGASAMEGNSEANLPREDPPSFRWAAARGCQGLCSAAQ